MFNNSDIFKFICNAEPHNSSFQPEQVRISTPDIRQVMIEILEGLRSVPSSANTQPWTIVVVQGAGMCS